MRISRRHLLVQLGAASLTGALGPGRAAGSSLGTRRLYLGANRAGSDSDYRLAAMTADGAEAFETPLPGRGHGVAAHPRRGDAVVFARRPGTFALALDLRDGAVRARLHSPAGRHFFGHGVFSSDGTRLFTTENDFDAGRGIIGVWDVCDGYRRLGEFESHGIGPHEVVLAPGGRALIVANGGILTHPDSGRRKLNIPTMDPSLAYLDIGDGALLASLGFETPRLRLLSVRHLAVNGDGVVCVGLQDQGSGGEAMPLVGFHRPGDAGLDLRPAPDPIRRRMNGYVGSVAMDFSGRFAVVSAPRGGLITAWDVGRRALVGAFNLPDGCGVAAAGVPGAFRTTSGQGGALDVDVSCRSEKPVVTPFIKSRHWDNHLVAVAGR